MGGGTLFSASAPPDFLFSAVRNAVFRSCTAGLSFFRRYGTLFSVSAPPCFIFVAFPAGLHKEISLWHSAHFIIISYVATQVFRFFPLLL